MGRETAVSRIAGDEDHNSWLESRAIDYGSDPLEQLIRKEERGEVIFLTGCRAWPYPGQDMEREPFPLGETPDLYVGACSCCGGSQDRNRWCAVCARKTPGVKPLPKDPPKKYVPHADGRKGGMGA